LDEQQLNNRNRCQLLNEELSVAQQQHTPTSGHTMLSAVCGAVKSIFALWLFGGLLAAGVALHMKEEN
jgi:hypothetical protein